MPKFFLAAEEIIDGKAIITGADARHIALALRMAVGEELTVSDFSGKEHKCRLEAITPSRVVAVIESTVLCDTEPPYKAILYQALPKGEKVDGIIQKAVECGVGEIHFFISERCISRPDTKAVEKKLERFRRISREAAMQCGRAVIPEISGIAGYEDIFADKDGLKLICYEGDGTLPLPSALEDAGSDKNAGIRFIVGAEGGFSAREVELARANGYTAVGLGPRILRCETAAAFALACFSYRFEQQPAGNAEKNRKMQVME